MHHRTDYFDRWEARQRAIDAEISRENRHEIVRATSDGICAALTVCLLVACVVALCAGCGGPEGEPLSFEPGYADGCVFDGEYQLDYEEQGGVCETPDPVTFYAGNEADECLHDSTDTYPTGVTVRVILTCRPGDPVQECDGVASTSEGCTFRLHMSRVGS